ncbi:hypothetical protein [Streptomyces sp. NPDC013740]
MPDAALLVRVERHREAHFRVSVGELVASQEEAEGEGGQAAPSGLKRFFG